MNCFDVESLAQLIYNRDEGVVLAMFCRKVDMYVVHDLKNSTAVGIRHQLAN